MKEKRKIFYVIRIVVIVWSVLVVLACIAGGHNKVLDTSWLMIYFLFFGLIPFTWATLSLIDAHREKVGPRPPRLKKPTVIHESPYCKVTLVPKKFTFPWQKEKNYTVYKRYGIMEARKRETPEDESRRLESEHGAKTEEEKEYWRKIEAFYLDGVDVDLTPSKKETPKPEVLPKQAPKKEVKTAPPKKKLPSFGLFSKNIEEEAGIEPEVLLDESNEESLKVAENAGEKREDITIAPLDNTDSQDASDKPGESGALPEKPVVISEAVNELKEIEDAKATETTEKKNLEESFSNFDSSPVEQVSNNFESSDGEKEETMEAVADSDVTETLPEKTEEPSEENSSGAGRIFLDLSEVKPEEEAGEEGIQDAVSEIVDTVPEILEDSHSENEALQKEVLLGIASLSEALEHFRRYVAKEPEDDSTLQEKTNRPHRRIVYPDVNTIFKLEDDKKDLSEASLSEKSEVNVSCLMPVDGRSYDESRPFIEWLEEDKREVRRADDNNGEIWWDKVKVDKYRASNPEFAYDNPFGHIFSDTVWYIDGVIEDPVVLEYVKKIEMMGGRIHRELSARCTHLLETSSGDETTFTKNMAKKYLLKDLSEPEFMDVVSIGQCTADKNRHLFPQCKMFNVVKEALKIEEEEDRKRFLFVHQYNDHGLILTYLDGDRKKTIAWKGDDEKGFWDVCGVLLTERIIVGIRPKEMLTTLAERFSEKGIDLPKIGYIDLVSLLGTYWRHTEKEKLCNMVFVTYSLGQEPPQSDKELSDAVCSVFMSTIIDRDVPVMRHLSSFVHQKQNN